jgi:hypothetical protein
LCRVSAFARVGRAGIGGGSVQPWRDTRAHDGWPACRTSARQHFAQPKKQPPAVLFLAAGACVALVAMVMPLSLNESREDRDEDLQSQEGGEGGAGRARSTRAAPAMKAKTYHWPGGLVLNSLRSRRLCFCACWCFWRGGDPCLAALPPVGARGALGIMGWVFFCSHVWSLRANLSPGCGFAASIIADTKSRFSCW